MQLTLSKFIHLFSSSSFVYGFSCRFIFRKDEFRVEIRVESDCCAERLALFALEAAEDARFSLGQQVGHFRIGERPAGYLAEHRQDAVRIVAAHHLTVEPHRARAALGQVQPDALCPKILSQASSSVVIFRV